MKTKQKTNGNALDEFLQSKFDKRSTIGKNVAHLHDYFRRTNNTMGISMLRTLGIVLDTKGVDKLNGSIEIAVHSKVKGKKVNEVGRRYERIGHTDFSGQYVTQGYPISYTIRLNDGNTISAGYTMGTRLTNENFIGPQQIDTLVQYSKLLNDKNMKKKIKMPKKRAVRAKFKKHKRDLESLLAEMPSDIAERASDKNVDLNAIRNLDVLYAGDEIAKGKWSALLWALDPSKKHNAYNWIKGQAENHELPVDVREAWIYLNRYPHLVSREQVMLLGAYRLQAHYSPRGSVAGAMPNELTWLATSKEAKSAKELYHKMYGKKVDLTVPHRPAKLYKGEFPVPDITVGKKCNDRYWTVADREGIARQFPMVQFREAYNNNIVSWQFRDSDKEFYKSMDHLKEVLEKDVKKVRRYKGDTEKTTLKNNYEFVRDIFYRMSDDSSARGYSKDNLVRRTSVNVANEEITRLRKTEWFLRPVNERLRER